MALPSFINIGTATVAANGTAVTGQGTNWLASVQPGDLFGTHKGSGIRILSVNSNTSLTLAYPWLGGAQAAAAYEIQITPDAARVQEALRSLLEKLSNGVLDALAGVASGIDKVPYFTGAGTAAVMTVSEFMRTLLDDTTQDEAANTLGVLRLTGGRIVGTPANNAAGVVQIRADNAPPAGGINTVFTINRPSSNTPAVCLGNDEGSGAVFASNNGALRIGKVFTGILNEYLRIDTAGKMMINSTGTIDAAGNGATVNIQRTSAGGNPIGMSPNTLLHLENQDANSFLQMTAASTGSAKECAVNFGHMAAPVRGRIRYTNETDILELWSGGSVSVRFLPSGEMVNQATYTATTASSANVFVSSSGGFARSTSSGRYKTQVENISDEAVNALMSLRPVWYRSTCDRDRSDWSWYGLIAEDVGAIDPRLVHWRLTESVPEVIEIAEDVTDVVQRDTGLLDVNGQPIVEIDEIIRQETRIETVVREVPLSTPVAEGVMYERLTVHLIAIAQRQQAQLNAQTAAIEELKARISALEFA